jgi:predicted PurR-regulated permease PerM
MATQRIPYSRPSWLFTLEGLVLIVAVLYFAKPIILPLALAILLTFVLSPIVVAAQRRGLGRVPAVLAVVGLTFVVLGTIGWGAGLQVQRLIHDLPGHKKEIKEKIDSLRGSGDGAISKLIQMFEEIGNSEPDQTAEVNKPNEANNDRPVILAQTEKASAVERLFKIVEPVLEPLTITGLVIILVVFMLIKREDLRNRVIGLLGHGHLTGTTRVLVDAAERLSSFLLSQLLVNAGFGIVFGISLFVLEVPYAFLWGFLTALLRFVPYIGSWIALAFPLLLSFAISPSWLQPVLVLVLFAVFDVVTANVIEPLVFGHSTGVAPIALLIAAAFWSWLWGPIGLVLSTPLTVCLVVLGQHIPRFKFLTLLLGDQPALTPHASYYQRLLARDRAEAGEVVFRYVQSHGVEKVFDDVFLPALVLTRRDRKLEGLTAEEEEFIYQSTREILDELPKKIRAASRDTKADTELLSQPEALPALLASDGSGIAASTLVLGCPAHHEAEELSLRMLDLLEQADHGRVEVLSTKALPTEVEARIDAETPALVFIAVLPPGGLVQASYLCKRLRNRFAELPIVVGYWGETRDFDKLLVRLRSAGAGYLTTSLLQSRSQIRALTQTAALEQQSAVLMAAGKP